MDQDIQALQEEFDVTRRELAEMAEEIQGAEVRLAALARQDVQVAELRAMLAKARQEHSRLEDRERALRAKFETILGERTGPLH